MQTSKCHYLSGWSSVPLCDSLLVWALDMWVLGYYEHSCIDSECVGRIEILNSLDFTFAGRSQSQRSEGQDNIGCAKRACVNLSSGSVEVQLAGQSSNKKGHQSATGGVSCSENGLCCDMTTLTGCVS